MCCLSKSPAGPAGHQACVALCMFWVRPRLYWPEPRLGPRWLPTTLKRLPKPALDDSSEISLPILAHSLGHRAANSNCGRSVLSQRETVPARDLANPEQLHQIAAQDGFFFGILQERRLQNEVNRRKPLVWSVGAINDLGGAKFRNEMP